MGDTDSKVEHGGLPGNEVTTTLCPAGFICAVEDGSLRYEEMS